MPRKISPEYLTEKEVKKRPERNKGEVIPTSEIEVVPTLPDYFNDDAKDYFNNNFFMLRDSGKLKKDELPIFLEVSFLAGEMAHCKRMMIDNRAKNDFAKEKYYFNNYKALLGSFSSLMTKIGATPADRSKVLQNRDEVKRDLLEELFK